MRAGPVRAKRRLLLSFRAGCCGTRVWCFPWEDVALVERPGENIAEKELMDRAWSGAAIEEAPSGPHGGHSEGAW
jgi:hypothetical protein